LALVIVAARAATHPDFSLHTLAAELRESSGLLDAFDGGGDGDGTNVRRVFSWSQSGLSTQAARLFGLLAVHPGPQIGVAEASVLAEQPPGQTRRLLAELSRAHLVEEVTPARFAFHDLLRAYAAELVEEAEDRASRDAAFGRLLDFYVHTALHADHLLNPLRWPDLWLITTPVVAPAQLHDADVALHWFRTEHPVLLGVLDQAYRRRIDVPTIQLAWALVTYLNRCARWHDLEQSQRAALAAARRLGDRRAEAHTERELAGAGTWRGEFGTATEHFAAALRLFSDLDDVAGQARTHRSLGWAFERQGRFREALEQTERALELHRELGYEAGLADALNAVGWFRAQLGDPAAALPLCEEALLLDQRIGHLEGEACTWDSLGFIHDALGDLERATTCYRRSVERFIEINDTYQEAATQVCLGDVYHRAGRAADAYAAWARADTAYSELGLDTPADVSARLAHRGELGCGAA
jgi:tetratricopeptide (TPR) repeat protein